MFSENRRRRRRWQRQLSIRHSSQEAPVCLVFCADPSRSAPKYGERGSELYSVQDATIAATYAMLAAVDLGLSTVWVGAFDEEKVQELVGDRSVRPVAMVAVGYPAEEPQATPRRAIEEIFAETFRKRTNLCHSHFNSYALPFLSVQSKFHPDPSQMRNCISPDETVQLLSSHPSLPIACTFCQRP